MISLDPINHCARVGTKSALLQPLTYDLFARLLKNENKIVTIDQLTSEVWEGVTVSPDTLKQRVFLLRKGMEDAGIDPKIIQSVRGKGYRLITSQVEQAEGFPRNILKRRLLLAGVVLLAMIGLWKGYSAYQYEYPINNRVIFWTESTVDQLSRDVEELKQDWLTSLSSNEAIGFVASTLDPNIALPTQARRARTALISYWTIFDSEDGVLIRIQILEPKTATVIRSDVVGLDSPEEFEALLQNHMDALIRIIEARALPLSTAAINATDHIVWTRLKDLAKDRS